MVKWLDGGLAAMNGKQATTAMLGGMLCVVEFTPDDPVKFRPDDEQSPVKVFSPWPEVKRTLGI